jgi:hypothetical protein
MDGHCSVDSLINLHKKAKAADLLFDDRGELSTTRGAWSEVRENIERGGHFKFDATL